MIPEIQIGEAATLLADGDAVFVDIRDPQSYAAGHIPGAILATPEHVEGLTQSSKSREVVVYCYHGNSSKNATLWFLQRGFERVRSMSGGFEDWRDAGEKDEAFAIDVGLE